MKDMDEQPKRSKIYYILPIIFAIIFILGIIFGVRLTQSTSINTGSANPIIILGGSKFSKLNDVLMYIQKSYVDSVSIDQLTEDAISSLLEKLDPHSVYISAKEFNEANDPLIGSFEGIGVEFRIQKDTITVVNVISGGPSDSVGIKAGDRIVNIDGNKVAGIKISNTDVLKKLKGKKGTKVNVSVFRRGVDKLIEYAIIRDVIPTFSLDFSYMISPEVGYIKLSKFSATSFDEFDIALKKLKSKGLKKLILDLRDNGGGYLQAAIEIADEFLEDEKLIVYTEGVNKAKSTSYATRKGNFEKGSLIILVNEFSASASEIVAGAVQDNDRGIIIGRRSFGKGLVQEQIKLNDGSAIRLTIARYYTPTGRCIQRSYAEGIEEYYTQFYEQILDDTTQNPDNHLLSDTNKYITPKGKIVYGGGGIMPDINIPLSKNERNKYFNTLYNKGLIFQYAFDYADKNRQTIKTNYKNANGFVEKFIVNDVILSDFINYSEKNGVKKELQNLAAASFMIKNQLKAFIGRNIFDDEAYYPIVLKNDSTLIKSTRVLDTLN